jgi:hypothetical protein
MDQRRAAPRTDAVLGDPRLLLDLRCVPPDRDSDV